MAKTYKSYQGKEIDMDKIMTHNELMPAVGNVKVNARGDELGPGGKIIKKREQVMAEYYEKKPNPALKPDLVSEPSSRSTPSVQQDQIIQTQKRGNNDSKRQNTSFEE